MDLQLEENFWGGAISDAISILRKEKLKKKKIASDNVVAFLFTREQVDKVLSVFHSGEINVWVQDGIYCLSRYAKETFAEFR